MKRVAIAAVTLSIPALVAAACSSFDAAPADSADSGPDGGTLTDGAPGPDGGLLLDAAPVGARSIRCNGNADCQGAAVCCVLNGSPEDRCVPSGKDCEEIEGGAPGLYLTCDDPTDCPSGQVCCGVGTGGFTVARSECRPPSNCTSEVLCRPETDDQCNGAPCEPFNLVYGRCKQ